MFRRNWIQYLSSESDSSCDYGYKPRDNDFDGANDQVGGGTPWEPPLPTAVGSLEHPSIVVWNDRDEERRTGAEDWSGTGADDTTWKGVPITLRRENFPGNDTVCTGMAYVLAGETTYGVSKWAQQAAGNVAAGEKAGGATLRIPYYWDGYSAKIIPYIVVWVTKGNNISTNDWEWRVSTTGGTITVIDLPQPPNDVIIGPITCPLDSATQLSSFTPGWNECLFKIGLTRDSGGVPASSVWSPGTLMWSIEKVYTSMPTGVHFQFKVQQNFTTEPNIRVLENGTLTPGTDNGNDAGKTIEQHTWPFGAPTGARNMATRSVWDVYSVNTADLNDYWWEGGLERDFPINREAQMRLLVCPESTVGGDSDGDPPPLFNENYFKYEDTRVNTAPPGGSRQWMATGKPYHLPNCWVPEEHMPHFDGWWYMPYNIKSLTYLVLGTPSHDLFPRP